jgi:hypothetical protein
VLAICRAQRTFAFSLGSAVVGLASALLSVWQQSGWGLAAASGVLVLAAGGLVVTWRDATALGKSLDQQPAQSELGPYEHPYEDWLRLEVTGTSVIYSPALNRRLMLEERPILVSVNKRRWQPEGTNGELARAWATRGGFDNESKIRLGTDLLFSTTDPVDLQRTDYAAYIATNNLAKRELWRGQRQELDVSSVATRRDTGEIRRLSDSLCSNHLGGDILAVSPGRVYLQVQGDTEVSPRKRVASGSGSLDFRDARGAGSLSDVVKRGLLRELTEELGLQRWRGEVPSLSDIKIIGYSRATYMAGKPQFYAVSRLSREVRPRLSRSERRWLSGFGEPLEFDPLRGGDGLMSALRSLQSSRGESFSDSLKILIEMLELWLESDPGAESWLFPEMVRTESHGKA